MTSDYSEKLVKSYEYWEVYVHDNQSYLGRCIIWCKRKDALDMIDATIEEQQELFTIIRDLQKAAKTIFQPSWFNYAFLGNETKHLHGHFIPRYKHKKEFMGMQFEDKLFGHNYKTDHNFTTPSKLLYSVRDEYTKALG